MRATQKAEEGTFAVNQQNVKKRKRNLYPSPEDPEDPRGSVCTPPHKAAPTQKVQATIMERLSALEYQVEQLPQLRQEVQALGQRVKYLAASMDGYDLVMLRQLQEIGRRRICEALRVKQPEGKKWNKWLGKLLQDEERLALVQQSTGLDRPAVHACFTAPNTHVSLRHAQPHWLALACLLWKKHACPYCLPV